MKHVVMLAIMGLFITFAGQQSAYAIQAVSEEVPVKSLYKVETLQRVADNVIIMFDSSGSMGEKYGNTNVTKLEVAKNILGKRADLMPDTMGGLNIGLYSYTPSGETSASSVYYEMQPFDRAKFKQAIGTLPEKASGPTLLVNGLRKVDSMLKDLQGRTVVFLFTDGTHSDDGATTSPFELAQNIVKKHDVSFQIVSTTDIPKQIEMMKKVSTLGTSSKVHSFRSLVNRPEVYSAAVFAVEEFYIEAAEKRNTVIGFKLDHLLFETGQATIQSGLSDELRIVGEILQQNPGSYIVLGGHTDNTGSEAFNLQLSRNRVAAVADYLSTQYEISPGRMELYWYGESIPFEDNNTPQGRKNNRRVVGYIAGIN
jgi:OOP family OmpA-OmpF porin